MGLAGRAVVASVDEASGGVVDDRVAARGEPGVGVVPLLAAGVEARRLPARLAAPAAAVHEEKEGKRARRGGRIGEVGIECYVPARVGAWNECGVGGLRGQTGKGVAPVGGRDGDRLSA